MKAEEQPGSLGSSKPGRAGGFTPQHRQRERGHGEGDQSLHLVPGSPPPHHFPRSLVQAMCCGGSSPNPCLSPCPPQKPAPGAPPAPIRGAARQQQRFFKGLQVAAFAPFPRTAASPPLLFLPQRRHPATAPAARLRAPLSPTGMFLKRSQKYPKTAGKGHVRGEEWGYVGCSPPSSSCIALWRGEGGQPPPQTGCCFQGK